MIMEFMKSISLSARLSDTVVTHMAIIWEKKIVTANVKTLYKAHHIMAKKNTEIVDTECTDLPYSGNSVFFIP